MAITNEIQQEEEAEILKVSEREQLATPKDDTPRKQEQSKDDASKLKTFGKRVVGPLRDVV